MRACDYCGSSLEGRRRHARFCGPPCRRAHHRLSALLRGSSVDGYRNLAEYDERPRKRARGAVRDA